MEIYMATPTTKPGTQLLIKIGNGASPEVFSHPCLINAERGIAFNSTTNDIIVPDCTNVDDPAWREVMKDGLSATITGAGIMDNVLATIQSYHTWFIDQDGKNVQVWISTIGKWVGSFKLTQFEITGARNEKINVSITLESDGVITPFAA
jgi:predicted secreted protein